MEVYCPDCKWFGVACDPDPEDYSLDCATFEEPEED